MEGLFPILLASFIVSLISLSGCIFLIVKEEKIKKYLIGFVAVSSGTLIATSVLHLIPESFEIFYSNQNNYSILNPGLFILFGILIFFFIEKFIHWHHHHDITCKKHTLSTLSIFGDAFHNFIDGALIAISFSVDLNLGIITTIAIIAHEIPQEIGDLAILLHSGFSKFKALLWNFISALFSVLGAVITYFFLLEVENIVPFLTALISGAFLYLALTDIFPELNKKHKNFSQRKIILCFLFGIFLIMALGIFLHH